ncbi:MAG: glycoside hydrolase family 1 protein [Deltaproteobacteria bacterium]|nr:glycoside hydrolase family 1 protein [Deltaproteobacteria bacterium]
MAKFEFPAGFFWGTAMSAHQVEGGNWNSDYWLLEHTPGSLFAEPSGDTCDHYHLYRDDLKLASGLGFDLHRFSIEWARIEPEEGEFSVAALDHYRRVLAACHEVGLKPCVTFHHFTSPRWVTADGGWEDEKTADRFARYCERAGKHLGDLIHSACTLNEANINASLSVNGIFPRDGLKRRLPFVAEAARRCGATLDRFSPFLYSDADRSREVMLLAHRKGREALRSGPGKFLIGIPLAMTDDQAIPGGEERRDRARAESIDPFLELARDDDFIGVQTYTRQRFGPEGPILGGEPGVEILTMGYEYWPDALEATIRYAASRAAVPVWVTENGIGTPNDPQRIEYVRRALGGVVRCLRDGIDVQGYVYWSLLDNFEWMFGYKQQFGIVSVDRATQERTPKPSARWLAEIVRANSIELA